MAAQSSESNEVATLAVSTVGPHRKQTSRVMVKPGIHSQDVFPFDKLPTELRVKIYRLAILAPGPIVLSRQINARKQMAKKNECVHQHSAYGACLSCQQSLYEEDYLLRANVTVLHGKQKRKASVQKASACAVVRATYEAHKEIASILYGHNTFVFATAGVFEQFCRMTRRCTKDLENVTIKDIHLPAHTYILKALVGNCKLRRLELRGATGQNHYVDIPSVVCMIWPLITKPGTNGCVCEALPNDSCICRTAEQQRLFGIIDFSDFNWVGGQPKGLGWKDLVEHEWLVWTKRQKSKQKAQKERKQLRAKNVQV
ncbi:hypothetical protein LTS10_000314 [Elasticomyces elasticus]|nr:hypothetical protein LTS10_000314 [Elasticomyces elasticus]